MERIHEFRWETTYFNGVDKKHRICKRIIINMIAIKDVYMLEGKQQVFIETDFDCSKFSLEVTGKFGGINCPVRKIQNISCSIYNQSNNEVKL